MSVSTLNPNVTSYIDCHCHLADGDFNNDIGTVIIKAKEVGVLGALVCACSPRDCERVIQLADMYPDFCMPCLGVHPQQEIEGKEHGTRSATLKDFEEALPWIEKHHKQLVAIGEVGLDFQPRLCRAEGDKDSQRAVLHQQVEIAKKFDLPLNVHSRSAGKPTITLLKEAGAERVLLHAFDGRPAVAMEGVQAGYFFSIPPSIIRSQQKQRLVERVPLDNLLLETDSPALGPEKQERNVPANIAISCEYIAKIKKVDVDTVARITSENALKLFPKIKSFIKWL